MRKYEEKNLKVVVGVELEFYIFEKNKFDNNKDNLEIENAYSINEIDINEEFFHEVKRKRFTYGKTMGRMALL